MADKATIEGELCVKEILKERGMKMKDLAEQMDIAPETLTRVLRGNPQYSTLKTIADTLGVSVRDLFKDKDVKTTDNEMKGCIFYNGEIHTFNTREEIEIFLKGN
jgi:transcriptional regulator with XRE-family HTH domain